MCEAYPFISAPLQSKPHKHRSVNIKNQEKRILQVKKMYSPPQIVGKICKVEVTVYAHLFTKFSFVKVLFENANNNC